MKRMHKFLNFGCKGSLQTEYAPHQQVICVVIHSESASVAE